MSNEAGALSFGFEQKVYLGSGLQLRQQEEQLLGWPASGCVHLGLQVFGTSPACVA